EKVIVGAIPVPPSEIDWLAEERFRLLSASDRLSLNEAFVVAGVKSMGSVQEVFAASVVEEEQTLPPVLASGKSVGVLRLEKTSEALPASFTVTVCGLSVLVKPTAV